MPARVHSPRTRLIEQRAQTVVEQERGADVVFVRQGPGRHGCKHTILAFMADGAYSQYGADNDVLWDNVPDVEEWRDEQVARALR